DDDFLAFHGLTKGDSNILSVGDFMTLSAAVPVEAFNSGGAGANMAYTLAKLGQSVRFLARVGSEPAGEHFFTDMIGVGVMMVPPSREVRTLEILVLVTPDGERTMAQAQPPQESADDTWVEDRFLEDSRWVIVEGYAAAAHPAAATYAWQQTPEARRALLLPAPHACQDHAARLAELMDRFEPMVIGNYKEYEALLGAVPKVADVLRRVPHVITSSRGVARFIHEGQQEEAAPVPVDVPVDSTGAGDAFAAGFLLEYAGSGKGDVALKRGHQLALATLQKLGPRLEEPAQVWAEPLV
ncbi:MAG: hypothetical protein COY40_04825, partial [Alphaproteobacteria bacterium CG_4_10_14_0_8_um_filter_53_9]